MVTPIAQRAQEARELVEPATAGVFATREELERYTTNPVEGTVTAGVFGSYEDLERYTGTSYANYAEQQAQDQRALQDWFDSLYTPATASTTVVDQEALALQTAAINDTLARGLEQLQVQFDLAQEAIDTRLTQADEQIQLARAKALESLTSYQRDIEERGAAASARIGDNALAAAMRNVAASDEALRRAGSMGGLVSAGGMRDIAAAGEQERMLMAGQSEIQQDLNERLTQLASQQSSRQQGLTEQIAQGASSTAEIQAQQLIDDLIAERSRQEFDISESNRQRLLELALNPPTKKVGGSKASGILSSQADVQMVAQLMKRGMSRDDALSMVLGGVADNYFTTQMDIQQYGQQKEIDRMYPDPLTPGQQLGLAQDAEFAETLFLANMGSPLNLVKGFNNAVNSFNNAAAVNPASQADIMAWRSAVEMAVGSGILSVDPETGEYVTPER